MDTDERRPIEGVVESERLMAELREHDRGLRLFFEHVPAAVAMFDRQMRHMGVSRRWVNDFGVGDRDVIGVSLYDLFPQIPETWREAHRRGLMGEVVRADEDSWEFPAGEVRWYEWEVRPWYEASGSIGGIVIYSNDITDRKRAESAFQESSGRFRALFDFSLDAVFMTNPVGIILAANPAACAMFGFSEEEFIAIGCHRIMDETDPRFAEALDERFRVGLVHGKELIAVRKNGERFPVEVDSVIHSEAPLQSFVIMRDISERKRVERDQAFLSRVTEDLARLTSAHELVDAIGEKLCQHLNAPQCLFAEVDETQELGVVKAVWNRWGAPEKLVGVHRMSEFVTSEIPRGLRSGEIVVVNDAQTDPRTHADAFAAFNTRALVAVPFHRAERWVYLLEVSDSAPREWRPNELLLVREVANRAFPRLERAVAEKALKRNESLLRTIIDNCGDVIFLKDQEGRPLVMNPAGCAVIGKPAEEVLGKTALEILEDADLARTIVENDQRVMNSGDTKVFEEEFLVDGEKRVFLTKKTPFRDEAGRVIGLVGVARDITDRKRLEEKLKRNERQLEQRVIERTTELRTRSEQLAHLAAELSSAEQRERRRMAQVLHDGLQQILVGAKFRLAFAARSDNVRDAINQATALINEAIETSRSLSAELSPPILLQGDLVSALQWLARWMRDKFEFGVDLEVDARIEALPEGVLLLLFQAVRELLLNAVKHAGVSSARIHVAESGESVVIQVEDKGVGFDPRQLRTEGGEHGGVGLLGIKERFSYVGGRLEIDSCPGCGSRFTLSAPIAGRPKEEATVSNARTALQGAESRVSEREARGEGGRIRIALVDDHTVMRQGLAGLIRSESDLEIVGEASNGVSAVALARQAFPDVMLMDISMPVMDGIQATRVIHDELPQVKIIGLSMFEDREQMTAMREAGASEYVTKSGPSEALIEAIRRT